MNLAISARNLTKTFPKGKGRVTVLEDLSFDVPEGSVVSFLGHNGAGKTTLIRILSTLITADSGTAEIFGHEVSTNATEAREVMATTGQFAAVDENLTGRENLVFFGRLRGLPGNQAKERADELLEQFGLTDAAAVKVDDYSGGMRRRLDIAVSLVVVPKLLFLDEPTTGLDPVSRRQLWAYVHQLRAAGMTLVLTTQYLEEAEELADTVHLLKDHTIIASGTPEELRSSIGGQVCTIAFGDTDAAEAYVAAYTTQRSGSIRQDGRNAIIDGVESFDVLTDVHQVIASSGAHPVSVTVAPPTLDDVFIRLNTSEALND